MTSEWWNRRCWCNKAATWWAFSIEDGELVGTWCAECRHGMDLDARWVHRQDIETIVDFVDAQSPVPWQCVDGDGRRVAFKSEEAMKAWQAAHADGTSDE